LVTPKVPVTVPFPVTEIPPPKVVKPVPKKEKEGFKSAFPKAILSVPFVVSIFTYLFVPSESVNADAVLSAIPKVNAFPVPLALILTVDPLRVTAPVVLPAVKVEAAAEDRVVLPLDVKVVNLALLCRSAPMAVLLIPVVVVLKLVAVTKKFPAVRLRLLAPVLIEDADSPDRVIAPEVPEILTADPAVTVNPLEAVSSPLEVIVPVPVVDKLLEEETLPEVVKFPLALMVKDGVVLFCTCKAILVPA